MTMMRRTENGKTKIVVLVALIGVRTGEAGCKFLILTKWTQN